MGNLDYGSGQLESLSYACEKEYIVARRLEAIGQHRGRSRLCWIERD